MSELPSENSISAAVGSPQEAILDFAVSQSSAVFYLAELDGGRPNRFISSNVESITGHDPAAFLAEDGYGRRFIHPDDLDDYERGLDSLSEQGNRTVEYRYRCGDGRYRWFRDEQRIVAASDGKPREFVGCMIDVTERVEAERETKRISKLLRAALDSVPNGFGLYDAEDDLVLCNNAFSAVFGKRPAEIVGKSRVELTRAFLGLLRVYDGKRVGDPEAILPHALARTQEAEREAIEMQLENGEWLQITSHQTADGGRTVIRTNITGLKQAELTLRDSEIQFRSIVEANPLPVRVADIETWEVIYESPAAAALFGRPWPARESRSTVETYAEEESRHAVIEALHRERRVDNFEVLMQREDRTTFWAALSSRVVRFHGKDVSVTSVVDLTEAKSREAELRQARETLEDAIEALSEGLALYDSDDCLVLCNSQYREYHKGSEDLLVPGASWPEVTRKRAERGLFKDAAGDIDGWLAGQMAQRGIASNQEFPFGDDRWFEYSHRPTRQGGFVSTWRDVTERKRMEENLRESEALVRQVLEASPVPLRMWRPETSDVLYESPASAELFGRDATKLDYESRQKVYVDLNDREVYLARLRESGAVDAMEMQMRRSDGSLFWGAVSARMIDYRGEDVVVSSIVDLSERRAMEQALRESEQHFRMLVEEHPLPVWMIDTDTGNLIYESPAAAELSGRQWLPDEERNVREFWADQEQRRVFIEALKEHGELRNFEIEFKRADGSVINVTTDSRLIRHGDRNMHITVLIDLTEQRQREQELREARETLEDAIESMPEGFSLFDAEDRLVMCNSRFREFNALSADALVPGTTWFDFIKRGVEKGQYAEAIGHEEEWLKARKQNMSLGTVTGQDIEFQQSDGRWFHAFSQWTRQGGFVGIRVDITDRKKMELALRENEELIRHVLEASAVPIAMIRLRDGKMIYENPAAKSIFGENDSDDPVPVGAYWVDNAMRDRFMSEIRKRGKLDGLEVEFKRRDGTSFWGSLSGRLIKYRGEDVVVDTIFDLTDRRAAEDELARQRDMLHQTEKLSALGELLAGVSHELNNPLSVLVGQALMLSEAADDEKTAARAEKDQQGRRSLRADRQDIPRHGAAAAAGDDAGRPQRGDRQRRRGHGLYATHRGYRSYIAPGGEPAGRGGRSRSGPPGHDELDRQCPARPGRLRGRAQAGDLYGLSSAPQPSRRQGQGQRPGDTERDPQPHLRAALHDQGDRHRHRHWPSALPSCRGGPWRHHRPGEQTR